VRVGSGRDILWLMIRHRRVGSSGQLRLKLLARLEIHFLHGRIGVVGETGAIQSVKRRMVGRSLCGRRK
jgi:hypothetical protein